MRILFLTFYYPPDLCAGSFRAGPFVEALREVGGEGVSVDVLTTMPNRYRSFSVEAAESEERDGISVRRVPLPPHRSGMLDQSRSFATFARHVLRRTRGRRWDLVVATSSRLMTAALAARVSRRLEAPLYLDIRDLFPDVLGDLVHPAVGRPAMPFLKALERRTMTTAARINVVSEGFVPYMSRFRPADELRTFPNGIDQEFLARDFNGPGSAGDGRLIVYAGNIGEGQGLHHVIPEAARALGSRALFRVIGDGGRRAQLERGVREAGVHNVELLDPVGRDELMRHYAEADVLFLHLNDLPAFQHVLPSKVFEYAATGKRLLAGVAGYCPRFIEEHVPGVELFDPCDTDGLLAAFERLDATGPVVDRTEFKRRFDRREIMKKLATDVLATAR